MKKITQIFLNERAILVVIIINAIVLFTLQCGVKSPILTVLDVMCTIIFLIEMLVKQFTFGFRNYWKEGWNVMDGTLVIVSIPSLISLFIPSDLVNLSFMLVLRVLRVFRFFRLFHFFPGFGQIMNNFNVALKRSWGVMVSILIMITSFAMISCSLFGHIMPEYFETPVDGIYTMFRIFTGEGWNEIPDTVAELVSPFAGHLVRIYFSVIFILGCIIGMSLLNSIFVDAMVSDPSDGLKDQLDRIEAKLDQFNKENPSKRLE